MATTGELRAIMEELQLVEIGDAATYLGEEAFVAEEFDITTSSGFVVVDCMADVGACDCNACQSH